jgi:hypothetical protein
MSHYTHYTSFHFLFIKHVILYFHATLYTVYILFVNFLTPCKHSNNTVNTKLYSHRVLHTRTPTVSQVCLMTCAVCLMTFTSRILHYQHVLISHQFRTICTNVPTISSSQTDILHLHLNITKHSCPFHVTKPPPHMYFSPCCCCSSAG